MTTNFGRYELRGTLGRGGFATVYRAWDPALGREVALKALEPHLAGSVDVRRRFVAEARALAGLHHGGIVTVHDVGEAEGRPFFAMELVAGQSLDHVLRAGVQLPVSQVIAIVAAVASALDALHAAGLVHRDVKPANIMLEPEGRVVLMDLGIARTLGQEQVTQVGTSLGTPAYMSPEQVLGRAAGPAADIYALGIVAYHVLAGHPPFSGDTGYVLHAQVYTPPPDLGVARPDLPVRLCEAVATALAKDPAARPATASAFAVSLAGAAVSELPAPPTIERTEPISLDAVATARNLPITPLPVLARRRRRAPIIVAAAVALAAVVGGTVGGIILTGRTGGATTSSGSNRSHGLVPAISPTPSGQATAAATVVVSATASPRPSQTASPPSPSPPPTRTPSVVPPSASPTAKPVVQDIGVSADDPQYFLVTVDRAQSSTGNGVTLALSFALHMPGWKSDNRPENRSAVYLTDEEGRRADLVSVTGDAARDNDTATQVAGEYHFASVAAGTRWVWLHYTTDPDHTRSLIVGIDLGVAAPSGSPVPAVVASQRIDVSAPSAGDVLLAAGDRLSVVRAENLGSGSVRLLVSISLAGAPGWLDDNRADLKSSIYLEDDRARRYPLQVVTGPAGTDDTTALITSGWYRLDHLPAGVQQVRLHYGDTVVPFSLGAAAPR